MANIVEYLEPIKLVYTTDCTEARVGLDFIVGSVSELVEINPVVFDEEPSAADLNDLDEEYKLAVKQTGTYILCIDSEHYGKSAACLGLDLTPCYISKYTELSIRYTKNTGSTANLSNGMRYPYLCVYKVDSDDKGLRLARCGDLTARPDFNFAEKYFNSEMMKPGEYVEFDTGTTEEVNKCKIKGSWLLNENIVFPEKKITQNVNFTTNQTLTNSDGASSNKFVRMQIGPESSARVQFDYWESITDVFFFEVHNVSWLVSEFDRILHYGDTEQWVSQDYYDFITNNGEEIIDAEGGEGDGEEMPDTPDPDIPAEESLEAKVQSIIDKANEVTGKEDTDLTSGVNSLVEGYGQGGECNHEIYDLAFQGNSYLFLKQKVDKPTDAQVSQFVDGKMALIPSDVEVIWGNLSFDYVNFELPTGDTVQMMYVRILTDHFFKVDVQVYYIWEDSVPGIKLYLESQGMDTSTVVGEGWYTIDENGVQACTEGAVNTPFWNENLEFACPYNDYLYSIFDFYSDNDKTRPIDVVIDAIGGVKHPVMLTQGKLCEKDLRSYNRRLSSKGVVTEDCYNVEGMPPYIKIDNIGQVHVEIVGDNDETNICTVYQYHSGYTAGTMSRQHSFDGNICKFTTTEGNTYGISVDVMKAYFKIKSVYTNATIVTQTDDKVYVSGLPSNTHIVVVIEATE